MTHKMMILVIQIGIILFAAKAGNMLFEKIKLPGVLGELTAGIIIGPYALGSIPFIGFDHGIFPLNGSFPIAPELYGFCAVASIVLLFMVGMETDIRQFLKYSVVGSIVGIGGVVFSFLFGDLLAVFMSSFISGHSLNFFSPEALFLGTISTATSVGITARILSEKRKMDSPEGVTILAGAVVDDVIGIIVLAVVLGIITASRSTGKIDWIHIGIIAAKTVTIWLLATVSGILLSSRIGSFLKFFKTRGSIALMGFGMALIIGGLFEEAGLAMIIGAYICGLSISRTDLTHVIREKLHSIYDFLVPLFFCVMGMLVNFKALTGYNIIIFGLIYSILAVIAKVVGAGFPALFFNFNAIGALRIGAGMIPRGEVALIVAGIGLASGFLPGEIFGIAILMTLITTIISPPLLVLLFNKKSGQIHEDKIEESLVKLDFPSNELANMFLDKIVKQFENEGFYAHLVDRDNFIYQIRKDRIIISLSKEKNAIVFDTQKEHEKLIHTAIYLISEDIENTIRELQHPIDKKTIALKLQESSPLIKKTVFDLSHYLKPDLIKLDLKGQNKKEILDELIDLVCKNPEIKDKSEISNAIWKRENQMSTGLQHGIAIPHGKTDTIDKLISAIGVKKEGIDFDSLDGLSTKIFIITLSPLTAPAPHVQFMSAVSQSLTEENINKIMKSNSKKEVYEIITGEKYIKKKKSIFDYFKNNK
ncbi:MAG: cation:proton antiporter [Spirochaetes bacterium]|nr:cation:proton antiporter [Spirochaetota bacterium]